MVRDYGLLEAALAAPARLCVRRRGYPDLYSKAATLLHSLARNHALVDGNKRLALAATLAFFGVDGQRLTLTNDEAYDLVIAVATGELDDVAKIAEALREYPAPRR